MKGILPKSEIDKGIFSKASKLRVKTNCKIDGRTQEVYLEEEKICMNQHFPLSLGIAHQLWLDVAKSLQYAKCCAQFAYFASTQQRSSNKSFQDFCLLHKSSTSQVQRKTAVATPVESYFRPCGRQLSMQLLPRPQRPKIGFVCYALPRHIPNGRLK